MSLRRCGLTVALLLLAQGLARGEGAATSVRLPQGQRGIGFDDLRYSQLLQRVVAPAGRTGMLDLVDPRTHDVTAIPGFSVQERSGRGHGEGTTSADEGRGWLFAIDRTAKIVTVVDPRAKRIVASAPLANGPDYVRFAEATNEVWVTEPGGEAIEVFSFSPEPSPRLTTEAQITVRGGPESLVIDSAHGRAYTHLWNGASVVVDLKTRELLATWPNTCAGARGIALDAERGFLFAGCQEGKAVVLDVSRGGKVLSSLPVGRGVDIIAYDPRKRHLYVPGEASRTMAILGVSGSGALSRLAEVPTAAGAHCVVADDLGNAWVCDPEHGRLLVVRDDHPRTD